MSVLNFWFIVFTFTGAAFYYFFPKNKQWTVLLFLSLLYYACSSKPVTFLYIIAQTAISFTAAVSVSNLRKSRKKTGWIRAITSVSILANILIWFFAKGRDLWVPVLGSLSAAGGIDLTFAENLSGALGMGYYTLQLIGYITDCYWENIEPQKNPLKLLLFAAFFPQLTNGPISRYQQLEAIFAGAPFSLKNISFGSQRILWGLIKKTVLADRLIVILSAIAADPGTYNGFYYWILIFLYPLQMYADFSGCMDIVIGTSEIFGICLPENFNNPFFARTSQEFWQRWHITLGTWARDYVLYPLLKTDFMIRSGKALRKKFGQKAGKFIVNFLAMFVLWMVIGIWHGSPRYIIGVSLWYWLILMLGNLLAPLSGKIIKKTGIDADSFSWHLFQSVRTYCIYAVGAVFFRFDPGKSITILKKAVSVIMIPETANPWIFYNGDILNTGITYREINVMIFVTVLMILTAVLREKYGYARIWIRKQVLPFRWILWIGLFVFLLVWGKYGPGYDASEFIYMDF